MRWECWCPGTLVQFHHAYGTCRTRSAPRGIDRHVRRGPNGALPGLRSHRLILGGQCKSRTPPTPWPPATRPTPSCHPWWNSWNSVGCGQTLRGGVRRNAPPLSPSPRSTGSASGGQPYRTSPDQYKRLCHCFGVAATRLECRSPNTTIRKNLPPGTRDCPPLRPGQSQYQGRRSMPG